MLISNECSLQHFFTEQTWNQSVRVYDDEYVQFFEDLRYTGHGRFLSLVSI